MAYIVGSTEVNQNEQWSPNQNQNLHSETCVAAISVVKAGKIMGQNVVAPGWKTKYTANIHNSKLILKNKTKQMGGTVSM